MVVHFNFSHMNLPEVSVYVKPHVLKCNMLKAERKKQTKKDQTGRTSSPETSILNQPTLRNIPEDGRTQVNRRVIQRFCSRRVYERNGCIGDYMSLGARAAPNTVCQNYVHPL